MLRTIALASLTFSATLAQTDFVETMMRDLQADMAEDNLRRNLAAETPYEQHLTDLDIYDEGWSIDEILALLEDDDTRGKRNLAVLSNTAPAIGYCYHWTHVRGQKRFKKKGRGAAILFHQENNGGVVDIWMAAEALKASTAYVVDVLTGEPDVTTANNYSWREKGSYKRGSCTERGTLDVFYDDVLSATTDANGEFPYTAAMDQPFVNGGLDGLLADGTSPGKQFDLHPGSTRGSIAEPGHLYARLMEGATVVACCNIQLVSQWTFVSKRVAERTFKYWGQTDTAAAPYTDINWTS